MIPLQSPYLSKQHRVLFSSNKLINKKNIFTSMKNRENRPKHKKRYSKISVQKRVRLVKMVLEDGLTLTKVAKLLHIKRPTAKVILKRFKESGTFFHKKISQARTKDSIESYQSLKIEQISQHQLSIQISSAQNEGVLKQQADESNSLGLAEHHERIGYVYYYPSLNPYQCFM